MPKLSVSFDNREPILASDCHPGKKVCKPREIETDISKENSEHGGLLRYHRQLHRQTTGTRRQKVRTHTHKNVSLAVSSSLTSVEPAHSAGCPLE